MGLVIEVPTHEMSRSSSSPRNHTSASLMVAEIIPRARRQPRWALFARPRVRSPKRISQISTSCMDWLCSYPSSWIQGAFLPSCQRDDGFSSPSTPGLWTHRALSPGSSNLPGEQHFPCSPAFFLECATCTFLCLRAPLRKAALKTFG